MTQLIAVSSVTPVTQYIAGLRTPCLRCRMRISPSNLPSDFLANLDKCFLSLFPSFLQRASLDVQSSRPLMDRILIAYHALSQLARRPDYGLGLILGVKQQGREVELLLPAVGDNYDIEKSLLNFLVNLLNQFIKYVDIENLKRQLGIYIEKISRQHLPGVNTVRFLTAAHERHIPVKHLYGSVFQYGWGRNCELLDSSLSWSDSGLGVGAARNKVNGSLLLKSKGLPVPENMLVGSEKQAIQAALTLSFPVVIKPADLDGGRAVSTGLINETEVRTAYRLARQQSKNVLVEKHYDGNDYRLQVCGDKVYWAVLRRPPVIIGDGVSTVVELISKLNDSASWDVDSKTNQYRPKQVQIDGEVARWLSAQGLENTSIPELGREVRLRGAANVSLGGSYEPVLNGVHPDNALLAIEAARALGLKLAGIDLLIQDISVSWTKSNAVICEVNAQPQISPGQHGLVLSQLLKAKGRIPVVGIIGGRSNELVKAVYESFSQLDVGDLAIQIVGDCQKVRQWRSGAWLDVEADALCLQSAAAALFHFDSQYTFENGIPVDTFDLFVDDIGTRNASTNQDRNAPSQNLIANNVIYWGTSQNLHNELYSASVSYEHEFSKVVERIVTTLQS